MLAYIWIIEIYLTPPVNFQVMEWQQEYASVFESFPPKGNTPRFWRRHRQSTKLFLLQLRWIRCYCVYSSVYHNTTPYPECNCWPCQSLYDHCVPIFWWLFRLFQQDKASFHKAEITWNWFLEHDTCHMSCSVTSPSLDLNLVEHLQHLVVML